MKVILTLFIVVSVMFFNSFSEEQSSNKEKVDDFNLEINSTFTLSTFSEEVQLDNIDPLTEKDKLNKDKSLADKIKLKIKKTIPFFEFKYDE